MGTVDVLDGKSLVLDAQGNFEIFVDADEKGDRANHIRSSPEAVEFYIRDVVADWARERPNMLTIERLGGAPKTPERSFDHKVADAQAMLIRNVDSTMRWNAQATTKAANGFDFTIDRDSDGALRNQIYIMGHFDLKPDEALVIEVGLGGAEYFLAPITNIWGTTNDIMHRTSSLKPDPGGTRRSGQPDLRGLGARSRRVELARPLRHARRPAHPALGRVRQWAAGRGLRRAQPRG